mmetsp:Transcript_40166/g.121077  ORF Transcript_40166/g.121077 Transcript_40166/m.121077 type:complete len:293 (-) Transcript_40166:792-1670(-)
MYTMGLTNIAAKEAARAGLEVSPRARAEDPLQLGEMGVHPNESANRHANQSSTVPTIDKTSLSDSFGVDRAARLNDLQVVASYMATYWKKGRAFPVDGRLFITTETLKFKPIIGKEKRIVWTNMVVTKAKTMNAVSNGIRVAGTDENGNQKSCLFTLFVPYRDACLKKMEMMIDKEELTQHSQAQDTENEGPGAPAVEPDTVLPNMEPIVTTKIDGVSVKEFYNIVWSEGKGTNHEPLYGPWLSSCGKNDVVVGDWEMAKDEAFLNEWCGQKYDKKRIVTFNFQVSLDFEGF